MRGFWGETDTGAGGGVTGRCGGFAARLSTPGIEVEKLGRLGSGSSAGDKHISTCLDHCKILTASSFINTI